MILEIFVEFLLWSRQRVMVTRLQLAGKIRYLDLAKAKSEALLGSFKNCFSSVIQLLP